VLAAVMVPYIFPIFDADTMYAYATWYSDIPLLIMAMIAFQAGLRAIENVTERRFWHP
jgi:hypothetical protein